MNTDLAAQAGPSVQEVAATQSSEPSVDLSKHPSGIVPVLQNIVATVNLSCKLDLKHIALRARNAEYNPKVAPGFLAVDASSFCMWIKSLKLLCSAAICCCHNSHQRPKDHCSGVCLWQNGALSARCITPDRLHRAQSYRVFMSYAGCYRRQERTGFFVGSKKGK